MVTDHIRNTSHMIRGSGCEPGEVSLPLGEERGVEDIIHSCGPRFNQPCLW